MKLVNELVKAEKYTFKIPTEGKISFLVKKGDRIKVGDVLFKKDYKKILDSFNISREFGVPVKSIGDYIARLNGEYVTKGEILAQRISKGGLSVKKIVATYDAILSFDRIKSGYIDLLSEHISEDIESKMIGTVEDVDYSSGLKILSNAFVFKQFISSRLIGDGVFEVLKEGESIYSVRDLAPDYTGKIVYVGRFAFASFIEEIMQRGAVGVVAWSMDYTEYEQVMDKVSILGGFGQISYDSFILKYITSMNGSYANITEENIYWCNIGQTLYKDSNNELVRSEMRVNDMVRIIDNDNFGKVGKIVDIPTETGYYILKLETDERVLLSEDTLEVIE